MSQDFDEWCLVELFGHQRLAGRVTSVELGGGAMIRVEVPAAGDAPAHTRFFNTAAIYGLSPVGEIEARALADAIRARPISRFEIPELRQQRIEFSDQEDDHDLDGEIGF